MIDCGTRDGFDVGVGLDYESPLEIDMAFESLTRVRGKITVQSTRLGVYSPQRAFDSWYVCVFEAGYEYAVFKFQEAVNAIALKSSKLTTRHKTTDSFDYGN